MKKHTINETIRPVEIESGNAPAGIGYIAIPEMKFVDREQYIEDCYRSHTVMIYGGIHYGYFYNVSIDKEVLKAIEFPQNKNEYGSPVVWVNIKPYNKPIIIAVLKSEEDFYLNDEGEYNLSREFNGNHIDIRLNSKKGTLDFAVLTAATQGKIKFSVINPDKSCEFEVYVKGKIMLHATEEVRIVSDKKIQLQVIDEDSKDCVLITYERGKGLKYIDEFENEVNIKEGELQLISKKINHNSGKEPMVLGDSLNKTLGEILDGINALTVPTAFGPSGTPINTATFIGIKKKLDTILSKISNLE